MNFFSKLKRFNALASLDSRIQRMQEALGRIEARQVAMQAPTRLADGEFRVFSQWGEDGIIQLLLRHVAVARKVFVEFGVENYIESNTRFLLINNNWSGLVIDASEHNIAFIRNDPIYWRYNLKAECSFVTTDNINALLAANGIAGDIGILSIDIDGNDFWVWKEITSINPAIVIVEYNARFGAERAVTTPYAPGFSRRKAHYSGIYYGASLKALCLLAQEKGYVFVGCNSAGNNAFFVRHDLFTAPLEELTAASGYVANQFREARNADGSLVFLTREQEQALLADLPLVEVDLNDGR